MPTSAYEIVWCDTLENVVICYFRSGITWSLYHPAIDELIETIKSKPTQIDVIVVGEVDLPSGNPFPHFRRGITRLSETENLGIMITTGKGINSFTKIVGDVIFRVMGLDTQNYFFATSIEECYDIIRQHREAHAKQA